MTRHAGRSWERQRYCRATTRLLRWPTRERRTLTNSRSSTWSLETWRNSRRWQRLVSLSRLTKFSVRTKHPLWILVLAYCKNPKNSDIWKICGNHPKIWTTRLHHRVMLLKDADGVANSVDSDQTAPLGGTLHSTIQFKVQYVLF